MIVWRGWGIVALLPILGIPLLALPIGLGLGLPDDTVPIVVGFTVATCAVPTWFLARWMNVVRPAAKLAEWVAGRQTELDQFVEQGTFHMGPGHPAPASKDDARQQAAALLETERQQLAPLLRNRSTMFFVPAQHMVIVIGSLGIVLAVANLVTMVTR